MQDEWLLEQARRAHDELDAIFSTIPDSIHIIDDHYRVVKANLSGARLQGLTLSVAATIPRAAEAALRETRVTAL